jgi:hypothetical protein
VLFPTFIEEDSSENVRNMPKAKRHYRDLFTLTSVTPASKMLSPIKHPSTSHFVSSSLSSY